MTKPLRNEIADLAAAFATEILKAIRSSSLEDILTDTGSDASRPSRPAFAKGGAPSSSPALAVKRGPGRPRKDASAPAASPVRKGKPGRLARRSPGEIAEALKRIVAHVKSSKTGLRAEQIRAQLGMDRKELPRVLKEGLDKRVLKSKGQKRATTYSA